MWKLIAFVASRPAVTRWLIRRAMRTPYFHLAGYMERYWLVPYAHVVERLQTVERHYFSHGHLGSDFETSTVTDGTGPVSIRRPFARLLQRFDIAIRVHHILRKDNAREPHDHPWNARTIILDGYYVEERGDLMFSRVPGDTATLNFGEFHRIVHMPDDGVWTIFITGRKRGTWGFLMPDGSKLPHYQYSEKTGYTT